MSQSLTVTPACYGEREGAFRLFFGHVAPQEQEIRVTNALHLVERGELDPDGILVAVQEGELTGVQVCLPVPGASALFWPPQVRDGPTRCAIEDALLRHAITWLRGRGTRLGQALLLPQETAFAAPLERNGFVRITSLWYLQHHLSPLPSTVRKGLPLSFVSYAKLEDPGVFHQLLLRTYEGSQDCPEINGVRTIDEIMTGHRAQGKHDPAHWWLAASGRDLVGVLLLVPLPESASWELAYVGVVPEARGRGFGRHLVGRAIEETRTAGVPRLTLSVDARNRQAWGLYIDMGFEVFDRREVFLAIWRPTKRDEG